MKKNIFILNISMIVFLVLSLVNPALAASIQTSAAQISETLRTDALVLVKSTSPNYADFQHFLQPYLDNFGIPYSELDIANAPITAGVADYAIIIIGHRQLDPSGIYLDSTEQGYIASAVNTGTGLVNFDNALSVNGSTANYQFVGSIFGFGYTNPPTVSGVTFSNRENHDITQLHSSGETISTGDMTLAGVTVPAGVDTLALSGNEPFLAATSYGQGRAVQWGTYDWMSHAVKGPLLGLDDLVWRSIVWAARKPFVMQGMPPFATMRMDDVSDPSWWLNIANDYGFIPWLGLVGDNIDDAEAAEISNIVNAGKATAIMHTLGETNFFYFDHYNSANFSDAIMADHYATATQWFNSHNIPFSKYVVPHFYEIGTNAFGGLENWGVEFIGTQMDPGQVESGATTWMNAGPYRLYEFDVASDRTHNPYYADFMTIPGHPEMNGESFNCVSEIRDVTGYDWMGYGRWGVAEATQDGTAWFKRQFDSMAIGSLFSHEYDFVNSISPTDWQAIMQGITTNIASYQPIYVSMDYACQYARAMKTSNISVSQYDPALSQVSVTLSGTTDMATKFYLFTDSAGTIKKTLVDVPTFSGSTQVVYTVPGALDHIVVTPNPGSVVAGANLQFIAQGYDANSTLIPDLQVDWQVVNGGGKIINTSGLFTAGNTPGTYTNTVVASSNGFQGLATVQVSETTLDHFNFDSISSPK